MKINIKELEELALSLYIRQTRHDYLSTDYCVKLALNWLRKKDESIKSHINR